LDQFLEHLLPITKKIVRIGSQSKSEALKDYNLDALVWTRKNNLMSGSERGIQKSISARLKEYQDDGSELCRSVTDPDWLSWNHISYFLKSTCPHHYSQLSAPVDEDGFMQVGGKRGNMFDYWRHGKDLEVRRSFAKFYGAPYNEDQQVAPRSLRELLLPTSNVWTFSRRERNLLAREWATQIRQECIDKLLVKAETHKETILERNLLRAELGRRVLETADVVGVTTTALAKNAAQLEQIRSKTLICEEAAEVLEVSPAYLRFFDISSLTF